jgi:hypothetical protein
MRAGRCAGAVATLIHISDRRDEHKRDCDDDAQSPRDHPGSREVAFLTALVRKVVLAGKHVAGRGRQRDDDDDADDHQTGG